LSKLIVLYHPAYLKMPNQRALPPIVLLPIILALSLFEIAYAASLAAYATHYIAVRMLLYTQDYLHPGQLDSVGGVSRFTNVDRGLIAFWLPVVIVLVFKVFVIWERQLE